MLANSVPSSAAVYWPTRRKTSTPLMSEITKLHVLLKAMISPRLQSSFSIIKPIRNDSRLVQARLRRQTLVQQQQSCCHRVRELARNNHSINKKKKKAPTCPLGSCARGTTATSHLKPAIDFVFLFKLVGACKAHTHVHAHAHRTRARSHTLSDRGSETS